MTPAVALPKIRFAAALAALLLSMALAARADGYIYWVGTYGDPGTPEERNAIGRASLDGSGVEQEFVPLPRNGGTGGVAVDDAHLYWANEGSIGRANIDGTGEDQNFIADVDVSFPSGVAVDEEHIYWVSRFADPAAGDPAAPRTGSIGRANLDGTGADQSFITGISFPSGPVAVDRSHLYWASYSADYRPSGFVADPARIGRANLDGSGVEESFIDVAGVTGIAVDDAHVWWAYAAYRCCGGIGRASLDGTGREPVIGEDAGDSYVSGVAVSNTDVYWRGHLGLGFHAGVPIGRARLDGSRVNHELIADTGASFNGGVAVDDLPFTFGKVQRNRRRGTARLTVNVPGPGEVALAKTKKVKRAERLADAQGSAKLPVKPRGNARKKLKRKGKATVKAEVTYTPDGGEPNTQSKRVLLRKRIAV